jgi:hypothetical protein
MNEPDPELNIPIGRHIDVADGHRSLRTSGSSSRLLVVRESLQRATLRSVNDLTSN